MNSLLAVLAAQAGGIDWVLLSRFVPEAALLAVLGAQYAQAAATGLTRREKPAVDAGAVRG